MIRVISEEHAEHGVCFDTIRDSIERGRDRLRVLANMVLTVSGLLMSSCFVFIVLLIEKFPGSRVHGVLRVVLVSSSATLLLSAITSIFCSLLRTTYSIVDETKFIQDLMRLYDREVRLFRISFVLLAAGMIGMFVSVCIAALSL